jgi:hypothetical protein
MDIFVIGGLVLAVVVAVRGLWSPCGLSMISTITPMSERGRGHRFCVTASWYTFGGVVGGATLGVVTALGAWGIAATGASLEVRATLLAVAALVTLASDSGVTGFTLPNHPRQVDETWLKRYRAWAYATGFGWQIGTGVATYVMTSGVYLLVAVGVLSGEPALAFGLGVSFGLVRGLAVFVSVRADRPDRLRRLHATVDRWARPSLVAAMAAQCAVLGLATTHVAGEVAAAIAGLVALGVARLVMTPRFAHS